MGSCITSQSNNNNDDTGKSIFVIGYNECSELAPTGHPNYSSIKQQRLYPDSILKLSPLKNQLQLNDNLTEINRIYSGASYSIYSNNNERFWAIGRNNKVMDYQLEYLLKTTQMD
eukprot:91076_1